MNKAAFIDLSLIDKGYNIKLYLYRMIYIIYFILQGFKYIQQNLRDYLRTHYKGWQALYNFILDTYKFYQLF